MKHPSIVLLMSLLLGVACAPTPTAMSTIVPNATSIALAAPTATEQPTATTAPTETATVTSTAANTATAQLTRTPTKKLLPTKTATPRPPTIDLVELQRQRLAEEFKVLNTATGFIPIDNARNIDKFSFDHFVTTQYVSADGYPIMISYGGPNGFASQEEARQWSNWIDWAIQMSPTLGRLMNKAKVRFVVEDTKALDPVRHDSDPQMMGNYWGIRIAADVVRSPQNYRFRTAHNSMGQALLLFVHETVRIFNQNTHPFYDYAYMLPTSPLQDTINKELATAASDDATRITLLDH